jgi:hypothetical protein
MGEVIRKTAAADDIVADGRAAHTAAQARGGTYKTLSEQTLSAPLKLIDMVEKRLSAMAAKANPLIAAQDHIDDEVDGFIARVSDDIWNDIGRPAADPVYETMFPSGITFYTDGPDDAQPARMELLADLLEAKLHPKLDAKKAKQYAAEVREAAQTLEAAVDAARKPRTQLAMYGRMKIAAARNVQMGLTNFKRMLKIAGMSETEIHSVIVDRAVASRKSAAGTPAPTSPPAATPAAL